VLVGKIEVDEESIRNQFPHHLVRFLFSHPPMRLDDDFRYAGKVGSHEQVSTSPPLISQINALAR